MTKKQRRINELERELETAKVQIRDKDGTIANLRHVIADLEAEIIRKDNNLDEVTTTLTNHNPPADCTPGKWCAACEFGKEYHIGIGFHRSIVHLCNKSGACANFVQKEV